MGCLEFSILCWSEFEFTRKATQFDFLRPFIVPTLWLVSMTKRSRLDDVELNPPPTIDVRTTGETWLRLYCKNLHCRFRVQVTDTESSTPIHIVSKFSLQQLEEDELTALEFQVLPDEATQGGRLWRTLLPLYVARLDFWVCPQCQQRSRIESHLLEQAFPHLTDIFREETLVDHVLPDKILPALLRLKSSKRTKLFA